MEIKFLIVIGKSSWNFDSKDNSNKIGGSLAKIELIQALQEKTTIFN